MSIRLDRTLLDEVKIHQVGLAILADIGLAVEDPETRQILCEHGCELIEGRIRIPESVVAQALASAPRSFDLYDRVGAPAFCIGAGETQIQTVGGTPFVIDLETDQPRPALLGDLQSLSLLIDKLPHIHLVATLATPTDVNPAIQSLSGLAASLMFTQKPVNAPGPNSAREARWLARVIEAATGQVDSTKQPSAVISILPESPLRLSAGTASALVETARLGFPISIVPLPVMGISCPLTMAGALAQQHAENLAVVVVAQLVRPGLPMMYNGRLSLGNMRTGASLWGPTTIGLAGVMAVSLGQYCGLPANVYGLATSAKKPDVQSGIERTANLMLPLLAGADVLGGAGSLGDIMAVSPIQLVIDDEIVSSSRQVMEEMSLEDDQFALNVLESVAATEGNTFMTEIHTVRVLRKRGQQLGTVSDRSPFGNQGEDMVQLARIQVDTILKENSADPLISNESRRDVEAVLAAAEREFGN